MNVLRSSQHPVPCFIQLHCSLVSEVLLLFIDNECSPQLNSSEWPSSAVTRLIKPLVGVHWLWWLRLRLGDALSSANALAGVGGC